MDTNITIPKKEIAPGIFSTGGTATMPTINPISNQPNVITPQALQPTTPINLAGTIPTPTVDTSIVANATQNATNFDTQAEYQRQLDLQKQTTPDQTPLNDILASLTASEQGLTGRGAEQLTAETQAGIPEAQKARATLQGQIKSQLAEYNALKTEFEKMSADIEAGAGKKGLTTGAVMGQQGAIARAAQARLNSKASEIGLLQAQDEALAGQIETAQNTVNRAIDLKYQDKEAEYQIKKLQYDRIKDTLTAEEKKRGEAMQNALKKEENALAETKENEKKANEYLFTAIQGKAPQSLIAKAQDLINKGAKPNEVARVLGQYSMSLADRLDIQLKQKQIDKLNTELTTKNPDAGELVKINGQDYIRYKDGTISNPVLPGATDLSVVTSRIDNKIKTLNKLTSPTVGLATSAGSLRGAPIPFLKKNAINDWRADAINIVQKLTVDELGRVKTDGVTFGALSNGEREAVGQAATALGAAMIYKGEGDNKVPTGKFRISEKKVIEEFNKIKQGYELDFLKRTGVSYNDYMNNPEIIKEKTVDDFIDQAGTALINTNAYGGYTTN